MTSKPWIRALVACAASTAACGPLPSDDATETETETETVTATLSITSPDVRCIQIAVTGATTATTKADVPGGATASLSLAGLAAGSTTFAASAYAVKCASATTATYVSDPITATVVVKMPLSLSFKMRPVGMTSGTGKAVLDFPGPAGRVEDFPTWTGSNIVTNVLAGPDGNVWALTGQSGVAVLAPTGAFVASINPTNPFVSQPYDIGNGVFGPDGNLWFLDDAGLIGRMTPSGSVRTFSVASPDATSIATGSDGNLWLTDPTNNRIVKVTTFGVAAATYPVTTASASPFAIASGPDGNLWFTEFNASKIGRITTAGVITEFATPTAGARPQGIAAGPDGNIWFVERTANKIGRITTAGAITEFALPVASLFPLQITRGADGNVWFTCAGSSGAIGKITPAGVITLYPAGSDLSTPQGIAAGPDGNVWFGMGPRVARLTL